MRRAVLDAAVDLFSDLGPSAVSLRDIAARANVNLGLLHRHFGSKADLVSASLRHLVETSGPAVAERLTGPELADETARLATSTTQAYVRMLAWSLLDGADPRALQQSFPAVSALVRRLSQEGHDDRSARVTAAAVAALTLGWALFEPYLLVAAELEAPRADELESELSELIGRLLGESGEPARTRAGARYN